MGKYRKFTPEYRDEAVKLVLENGRPIADVARELEVFYNRQRLHSGLGYRTPLEVLTEYQQNVSLAA